MDLKELTEDFEILIVAWLKSNDENATNLAHSLAKYAVKKQLLIHGVSNRFDSKYTPPFRVGRKQGKAVLDATGREVIFFSDSEEQARKYCNYLNGC